MFDLQLNVIVHVIDKQDRRRIERYHALSFSSTVGTGFYCCLEGSFCELISGTLNVFHIQNVSKKSLTARARFVSQADSFYSAGRILENNSGGSSERVVVVFVACCCGVRR